MAVQARGAFALEPLALAGQISGRDQHRELLAPDDYALILGKIRSRRNGVALAALEGTQPAEIDKLLSLQVARGADLRLRHQIDMELRAGADLEVRAQEHTVRPHRRAALAPVDGVARVGVDERALGEHGTGAVGRGQQLGGRGRRKNVGKQEEAERDAEGGAEHGAGKEGG